MKGYILAIGLLSIGIYCVSGQSIQHKFKQHRKRLSLIGQILFHIQYVLMCIKEVHVLTNQFDDFIKCGNLIYKGHCNALLTLLFLKGMNSVNNFSICHAVDM